LSFRAGPGREESVLSPAQLANISIYVDLLLRWNSRINLTAIREAEEIVTRHFGESLFAARHLFPSPRDTGGQPPSAVRILDVGSGAGFPGLPIKIWAPDVQVTLIESNNKKATFLREVIRTLTLKTINVFPGRVENLADPAEVVTLRAVEQFANVLPAAARLVADRGRLALLIGEDQCERARELVPGFSWSNTIPVPLSTSRTLFVGTRIGSRTNPVTESR